ncbi:MAG: hypothetical protein WCF18_00760 [Chthoniobacteraceae bacterium]
MDTGRGANVMKPIAASIPWQHGRDRTFALLHFGLFEIFFGNGVCFVVGHFVRHCGHEKSAKSPSWRTTPGSEFILRFLAHGDASMCGTYNL